MFWAGENACGRIPGHEKLIVFKIHVLGRKKKMGPDLARLLKWNGHIQGSRCGSVRGTVGQTLVLVVLGHF